MKRTAALIFSLILACLCMLSMHKAVGAKALQGSFSLNFSLTDEVGRSVINALPNDVITVTFTMQRTDSNEDYAINGFQNYIHYDRSFFEFVDGSIVCYDGETATAKKQNSLTYGEIIQCQNMGNSYAASFIFCTFQLKVIGTEGSGTVYNGEVYAFDTSHQSLSVTTQHLQVIIGPGCEHESKTKVDAKPASCEERGWDSYYTCNSCGAFFDESGEKPIEKIPYIEEGHRFTEAFVCDESGHWYECSACKEKKDFSAHIGGVATCIEKATCKVCLQPYGTVDADNHTAETTLKNRRITWFWGDGYSGDVCCSSCEALIEQGKPISMYSCFEWPFWIWVIAIPLSPIVVIGWLFLLIF